MHTSRVRNLQYRDRVLLPALPPSSQALLRPRQGLRPAHGWRPSRLSREPPFLPADMQLALRRLLHQPLPLCRNTCGPTHGCGKAVERYGDHASACPRAGLLARRTRIVEHAWVSVAREAPQQWLAHTTAPNVGAEDRRRLDLVVYGATPHGGALCCDATLVFPLMRTGHRSHAPLPSTEPFCGWPSERRKQAAHPEFACAGPQKLVILGSEVGGRGMKGPRSLASHARSGNGGLETAMVDRDGQHHWAAPVSSPCFPAAGRVRGPAVFPKKCRRAAQA